MKKRRAFFPLSLSGLFIRAAHAHVTDSTRECLPFLCFFSLTSVSSLCLLLFGGPRNRCGPCRRYHAVWKNKYDLQGTESLRRKKKRGRSGRMRREEAEKKRRSRAEEGCEKKTCCSRRGRSSAAAQRRKSGRRWETSVREARTGIAL